MQFIFILAFLGLIAILAVNFIEAFLGIKDYKESKNRQYQADKEYLKHQRKGL